MQISKELSRFVSHALQQGRSKSDIKTHLEHAGWTSTEIDTVLDGWHISDTAGPVPKPIRSANALDAFFYALLFVAFGMVAGNLLTLAYGQLDMWFPDHGDTYASASFRWLRWSMAAVIVFLPTFLLLNRRDALRCQSNPARKHGAIRNWLNFLALFLAMTTLLVDAVYLLATWLDGQLTLRFVLKSLVVAGLALLTILYFQRDKSQRHVARGHMATWVLAAVTASVLALSFWTVGGAAQGRVEQLDRWRLADLSTLANAVARCDAAPNGNLPETLDPMICATHPERLTGFARDITYTRISDTEFKLCIPLSDPARANTRYAVTLDGHIACHTAEAR